MPYFVEYVTQLLVNKYGEKTTFNGGLRVFTTIDLSEQAHAEKVVRNRLRGVGQAGTPISGALVSIDPRDGEVKAMVGGVEVRPQRQEGRVDVQHRHRRPPPAGLRVQAVRARRGAPEGDPARHGVRVAEGDPPAGRPHVHAGQERLPGLRRPDRPAPRDDRVRQHGLRAADQAVHPDAVVAAAHDLGINSPLDPNLSIGLGGVRIGVTPLEMAHAYASLASRGARVGGSMLFHTPDAGYESPTQDPISIMRVEFPDGHEDMNRVKATRAMSETDALTQIDAMRGVVDAAVRHRQRRRAARAARWSARPAPARTSRTPGSSA